MCVPTCRQSRLIFILDQRCSISVDSDVPSVLQLARIFIDELFELQARCPRDDRPAMCTRFRHVARVVSLAVSFHTKALSPPPVSVLEKLGLGWHLWAEPDNGRVIFKHKWTGGRLGKHLCINDASAFQMLGSLSKVIRLILPLV